ncbi:MAG: hypothetical protein ABI650_08825 [Dokdonella sp.]
MHRRATNQRGGSAELRRRIAVEAARLIAEEGMRDFHEAKQKAAMRLGIFEQSALPRNSEIDDALREHQRLFHGFSQPQQLRKLRLAAIEAMRFLARFDPRLVGAVLDGSADDQSVIRLHVFADDVREVFIVLDEHRIPYEELTRTLRASVDETADYPALQVSAGDDVIDLTVFPVDGLRQAPLDRITAKPMRRAPLAAVEELVSDEL